MTEVYVAFPSADHNKAFYATNRWAKMGYKAALFTDESYSLSKVEIALSGPYMGYWDACNKLAMACLKTKADVVVFAADDIEPDKMHSAQEIGRQYLKRFPQGLGVMQPCGDLQGIDSSGRPASERICGSPWIGRAWIERAFGGKGPFPEGYWHFYGDEHLKEVAERLGLLFMDKGLIQTHMHWSWGWNDQTTYQERNSREHWQKDQVLFFKNKAAGFPGSELLREEAV